MRISTSRLFCFGLGYIGRYFAAHAKQEAVLHGTELTVHGTTRNPSRSNEFLFDDAHELSEAAHEALHHAEAVLIAIPPDSKGDRVLRQYHDALSFAPNLKWVGYCSSIAVYGDHRGNWVDEKTVVNPLSERALNRVRAEKQWLESGLPVHIFRLGGIYGPMRSALEQARNHVPIVAKDGHVMNRVHIYDAVRALYASMQKPDKGAIYNICDDLPASREDVLRYAYEVQGLEAPAPIAWDEANLSPKARSFFEECKRVRCDITRKALGLELSYPDFRAGLDALYQQDRHAVDVLGINDNDITIRRQIGE